MVLVLICVMYGLTYIDRINVSTAAGVFQQGAAPYQYPGGPGFLRLCLSLFDFSDLWRVGQRPIWGATRADGLRDYLGRIDAADRAWRAVWRPCSFARVLLGFGEGAAFPTATRALCDWMPEGGAHSLRA